MRSISTFLLIAIGSLGLGCGTSHDYGATATIPGGTGYFDKKNNQPFLTGGDPYVEQRLRGDISGPGGDAAPVKPANPAAGHPSPTGPIPTPAKPAPASNALTDRLKEFEFSRFTAQKLARFGTDTFELKVFFKNEVQAVFKGALTKQGQNYSLRAQNDGFTLACDNLSDDTKRERTTAVFVLTDKHSGDSVEISLRAEKQRLTVHEDADKPIAADSEVATQVKALRENTFAWTNNWNVVNGPAFYLVDLISVIDATGATPKGSALPALSFRGESKRTAGEDQAYVYDAETLNPEAMPQVKLVGNSESGAGRSYQVTLRDSKTKQDNDIVLDVQPTQPEAAPQPEAEDVPDEFGPAPGDENLPQDDGVDEFAAPTDDGIDEFIGQPAQSSSGGASAKPAKPATPAAKRRPISSTDAFLSVNMKKARIARMAHDLERSHNIAGVRRWIAVFQHSERDRVTTFHNLGYPLRDFMQLVSEAWDINPIWAVIGADESKYFLSQSYKIEAGDPSTKRPGVMLALGPFQIHSDTGTANGLFAQDGAPTNDERRYFAPSACAAARVIISGATRFWKSDTTLAILDYNQGAGGARAFARRWGYDWPRIDALRTQVDQGILRYVNRKLALYFISNNRHNYGFDSTGRERTQIPDNAAPKTFHDQSCQAIWLQSIRSS